MGGVRMWWWNARESLPSSLRAWTCSAREEHSLKWGTFVDAGDIQLNPHRHLCAKSIRLFGQVNLAYTGIIPSVKLMQANQEKYDFNKIVTHRFPLSQGIRRPVSVHEGGFDEGRHFSGYPLRGQPCSTNWHAL